MSKGRQKSNVDGFFMLKEDQMTDLLHDFVKWTRNDDLGNQHSFKIACEGFMAGVHHLSKENIASRKEERDPFVGQMMEIFKVAEDLGRKVEEANKDKVRLRREIRKLVNVGKNLKNVSHETTGKV